ncbi:OsmC family protein [Vibrio lentus]|nr:OsmC family protein [Vibrio lentus]
MVFNFDIDANSNQAPCPTEVLLSALGACSATGCGFDPSREGFEISGLENNVTHTLTDEEPRLYKSANLHFQYKSRGISESDILTAARSRFKTLPCLLDAAT